MRLRLTFMSLHCKPPFELSRRYGVRQLLERKQGLFRMNMMGKRVNHACRSVISPDLNVRACEIGLPLRFAKALSWPENVSVHNVAEMRKLVERGNDAYPGANWVRDAEGWATAAQARCTRLQTRVRGTRERARGFISAALWPHLIGCHGPASRSSKQDCPLHPQLRAARHEARTKCLTFAKGRAWLAAATIAGPNNPLRSPRLPYAGRGVRRWRASLCSPLFKPRARKTILKLFPSFPFLPPPARPPF